MAERNILKKQSRNVQSPMAYAKSTKQNNPKMKASTKKSKKHQDVTEQHEIRRKNFYLTASNPELSSLALLDVKDPHRVREEEMENMIEKNMMITRPFTQDNSVVKTLPLDKKKEEQFYKMSSKNQRKLSTPEAYHSVSSYNRQASVHEMLADTNVAKWTKPLHLKQFKVGSAILGLSLTENHSLVTSSVDNCVRVFDRMTGNVIEMLQIKNSNKKLQVFQAAKINKDFVIASGEAVTTWTSKGKLDKEYAESFCQFCKHLHVDKEGSILATDSDKHSVVIISHDGNTFKTFGTKGDHNGELFCPTGIASLSNGDVVVADWKDRIQIFHKSGEFKQSFGRKGCNDGELELPYGLTIDAHDNIIVADWWNNRVSAFTSDGEFIKHLLTQENGIVMPAYVCVAPGQQLFLSEFGSQIVKVFEF